MSHPVDLILEALDVLGLLHELVLWNHEGELGLLVVWIQKLSDYSVGIPAYGKSEGEPDCHPLDRVAVVDDLRSHQQLVVPFAEVLLRRKLVDLSLWISL